MEEAVGSEDFFTAKAPIEDGANLKYDFYTQCDKSKQQHPFLKYMTS